MYDSIHHYAAVVFDFDGTLADSYAAIACSVNHVRGLRGLGELSLDEVKHYVGRGAEYLLEHTVPDGQLAEDLARYRVHHPNVMLTMTHLLPGAAALVSGLHQRGKKVGLCSNKPRFFSAEILKYLGLAAYFEAVLGPDDVPKPKPAPDMLLLAIDRLGVPAERLLYVGDMTVDIQTARAAGVTVWAVATGSEPRRDLETSRPDRLLTSLQEMIAELDAM
ncbi:MAG: HAD family hydrolase [Gemmataceae bacterium]|nr:HAD family hydrolase [Gemmataceae bacterium]